MEIIKPAFAKNNVAVCFSANDKYAPLLATTVASIAENSSAEFNYDLVVLYSAMSQENQRKIESVAGGRSNFSIRFVCALPYIFGYTFFTESELTNTKYSEEIYYRLLAPAIFEGYEKLVFLDADLVVRVDIAKLFDINVKENLVAAVRDYEGIAACYNNNYERTKYRISELGIEDFNSYFISGVLVINIEEFGKQFSLKQLLDMASSKNWKQYDQDVLNFLCKGKVKIIDAAWDYVEDIKNVYTRLPAELFEEIKKCEKNPFIVHYSADRKPWINLGSKFNAEFWKYASLTPYYDKLKNFAEKCK